MIWAAPLTAQIVPPSEPQPIRPDERIIGQQAAAIVASLRPAIGAPSPGGPPGQPIRDPAIRPGAADFRNGDGGDLPPPPAQQRRLEAERQRAAEEEGDAPRPRLGMAARRAALIDISELDHASDDPPAAMVGIGNTSLWAGADGITDPP